MPSPSSAPLFVVFNLGSGAGDALEARRTIEDACRAAGREVQLLAVDAPQRLPQLAREAVRRAREAGGIVVAAGGDGTLNTVAQAVLGSGCAFGVLPQGTFNYFSRTHGIPADTAAAMQVLLHEAVRPVQVGLVNDRVFLVNASLGLYPRTLEDRELLKRRWGRHRLVAIGAALLTLWRGYADLRLRLELNGVVQERRTPTLFVGNNALQLEQIGVPQAAAVDAGQLAALLLRPVGRLALIGLMLSGALGRLGEADQVESFAFGRLTVRSSRLFRVRRLKVATDGEVAWLPLPLEFSVAPQALNLIRPAGPAPERAAAS